MYNLKHFTSPSKMIGPIFASIGVVFLIDVSQSYVSWKRPSSDRWSIIHWDQDQRKCNSVLIDTYGKIRDDNDLLDKTLDKCLKKECAFVKDGLFVKYNFEQINDRYTIEHPLLLEPIRFRDYYFNNSILLNLKR